MLVPATVRAQTARVSIDFGKDVNILTTTSIGVPVPLHDENAFAPALVPYLRVSGATTLRYPGNHGAADLYHWESRSMTPYKGADASYVAEETNFGNFVQMVDKLGSALVVVNYGSNAKGTGGGEPAEAAAWVSYANGDPADNKSLGTDKDGTDWKTVGFWAGLRGSAPLRTDDGYNFLRINHPKPLKIELWQVGDEVYNNGYFGGEHVGDPDFHAAAPASPKDLGKLRKDASLAPAAFASKLLDYAKAMKAVDPSIQIGAGLTAPPDDGKMPLDFNVPVLRKACAALDFVTLEWTPTILLAPDYKTLDEQAMFTASREQLGSILNTAISDDKVACPKGHAPRLAFAPAAVPSWPKIEHPAFTTLWVADVFSTLVESGSVNTDWSEIYGDSFLSADRKKFGPAFYGLQMVHIIAHNPGDSFVSASSSDHSVAVHATRRRDGLAGIMLINENPSATATVKLSLAGLRLATKAKRFDYGMAQQKAGGALAQSDVDFDEGSTFSVPPYTVTDLVIAVAK